MMDVSFSDEFRVVMQLANQEAQRFNHEYIGTEHILLGILKAKSGIGPSLLKLGGVCFSKMRENLEKQISSGPDMVTIGKLPQTPRAKNVIEYAILESRTSNKDVINTGHLLIGLILESEGPAAKVLRDSGWGLGGVTATRQLVHDFTPEETIRKQDDSVSRSDPVMVQLTDIEWAKWALFGSTAAVPKMWDWLVNRVARAITLAAKKTSMPDDRS